MYEVSVQTISGIATFTGTFASVRARLNFEITKATQAGMDELKHELVSVLNRIQPMTKR